MSAFNGSGTFIISGVGLPYVTATVISSTVANQLNADLAAGLSNCMTRDGQSPPTANIPFGGFKATGLAVATANGDALSFGNPATFSTITATTINTTDLNATGNVVSSNLAGRNMVINGDMRVDQRNGGTPVTINNANSGNFFMDRFQAYCRFIASTNSVTMQQYPAGPPYQYVIRMQVIQAQVSGNADDYGGVQYSIEGLDFCDANFGGASAKSITISFVVNANVAGTYGIILRNSANDRYCASTYTVNVASAWEYKTITFPGDTLGTWLKDNGAGLRIFFDHGGAGNVSRNPTNVWTTNGAPQAPLGVTGVLKIMQNNVGATWHIGNLKVEIGTAATPFAPDSYQQSLAKCQRYYETILPTGFQTDSGFVNSNSDFVTNMIYKTQKRAAPTVAAIGPASDYASYTYAASVNVAGIAFSYIGGHKANANVSCATGVANGVSIWMIAKATANNPKIVADAEM